MFERFTEKAIKVIMLAQEEARRLGHNFVGTEQILLGLIGEGTGIAAQALRDENILLNYARREVEKIIGRGSGFVAVEIPFTLRAKRILELSLEEACQFSHNYIGTEHVLLGLIQEGEGVGARVLEILGVELSRLRRRVIRYLDPESEVTSTSLSAQLLPPKILETLQSSPSLDLADKAVKVLLLAREETYRSGFDCIGTEQILLGLLAESLGGAAQILTQSSISLKTARAQVKTIVGHKIGTTPATPPFSPKAEQVLQAAIAQARSLNHPWLDTEHLLFGILDQPESVAISVLERLGTDRLQLQQITLERLSNPMFGVRSSPETQLLQPILQQLLKAIHADQPAIQQQAILALAAAGSVTHVAALIPLLQNRTPSLRIAVITALESIGGPVALNALTALAQDPDPRIRWRVEQAIAHLDKGTHDRTVPLPPVDPNSPLVSLL